jgi:large subunit ribosomal protein L18
MNTSRKASRQVRKNRVRAKISGTATKPRFNVFRSLSSIYVQVIDDVSGKTLAAASAKEVAGKGTKSEQAKAVGKKAAEKTLALGIKEAVFDRGGYQYHGRVKSVAEGAREAGLKL